MVYNPIDSNTTIKVLNTEMANLKKSVASSISAEDTKIAELQNQINNLSNTTPSGTSSLTTRQFSKQVTISAGDYVGVSFTDVEVQGYKPVGLIGVAVTGSNNTKVNQYRWSAKSSDADYPYVGVRNYGTSNATVTVTITALYYANDSVIYGERGLQGVKGDKGDTGDSGYTPIKNVDYFDGAKGDKGDTGERGSDGTSCTHSWNGTTLTITSASGTSSADLKGAKGDTGEQGIQGEIGLSWLSITTAPSSYTTQVGDVTPSYRILKATVISQAMATPKVGDSLRYSYYLYPVIYIDDSYVYTKARVSIRGATGSAGTITIGATYTGSAGTDAKVENTGTSTAANLKFTIPRGDKGEKGDKGDPGTIDETTMALIVSQVEASVKLALNPVGKYIITEDADYDPNTDIGGTWELVKDRFILGAGDTYSVGDTGGSADAVLVSHNHAPNDRHYFVSATASEANNTRVTYSSSGNRYVDGGTANMGFSHRASTDTQGEDGTGKNMPPYIVAFIWKRIS